MIMSGRVALESLPQPVQDAIHNLHQQIRAHTINVQGMQVTIEPYKTTIDVRYTTYDD